MVILYVDENKKLLVILREWFRLLPINDQVSRVNAGFMRADLG